MESPFIYNKHVTGKNFVGRKQDLTLFQNFLTQGENVSLYEAPKSGKHSLVQQAFFNMRVVGQRFNIAEVSFLNIRTVADLTMALGTAIIKACATSPEAYSGIVATYLAGTHFVFDEHMFAKRETILSLGWDIDENDIKAVVSLPYRIAKERRTKLYVYVREFQNVMLTEDGELFCSILDEAFKTRTSEDRAAACWIMCGSQVNAMKDIFEHRHFFYHQHERVKLSPIDRKDIVDHTVRSFLNGGKVVERELIMGVCKVFRDNFWYINHFAAICDSLSRGYMMEPILVEALDSLIAIHEPRFIATMNDLTTFQVCLLRAIIDGHTKFSSAEVIHRYNLNSSANVRRLKDALCKKEIVTFNAEDEPEILDPLFEHWVRTSYFGMTA